MKVIPSPLPSGGTALLLTDRGRHAALAVPLTPETEGVAAPRLTTDQILEDFREYRGCAGADGVSAELLVYCADMARRYGADVRWVRWRDGSQCLLIRTPTCAALTDEVFLACYDAARRALSQARAPAVQADSAYSHAPGNGGQRDAS